MSPLAEASAAPVAVAPPSDPVAALPLTVIEKQTGWALLNWRELWRYHELLVFLTWRDIKVRYKQTVLGAAWAILQPLATMIVFSLFLGKLQGIDTQGIAYPLFVIIGLVAWNLFAGAISSAGQSVVGSQDLVTKVYFPRLIIPMAAVGVSLVDFMISSLLIVPLMLYFQTGPGPSIVLAPLILGLLVVAALGVGTMLSALTVAYRDFRYVVPFMIQLWMFATPSIYMNAEAVVGRRLADLLPLNPAHGLILTLRQALLGRPFHEIEWYDLAISGTVSVLLLVIGSLYFRRVERHFADII